MSVYTHSTSNDYSINTIEYMVSKKTNTSTRIKRILFILAAVIVSVAVFALTLRYTPAVGAVVVLIIAYFIKIFWSSTCLEYEYTIVQGELTMDVIIGARKRKTLASFLIRNAESIAPYNGSIPEGAVVIDACIAPDDPATWCALYKDESGVQTALLFSAFDKGLDMMAYYNRSAVSKERINSGYKE